MAFKKKAVNPFQVLAQVIVNRVTNPENEQVGRFYGSYAHVSRGSDEIRQFQGQDLIVMPVTVNMTEPIAIKALNGEVAHKEAMGHNGFMVITQGDYEELCAMQGQSFVLTFPAKYVSLNANQGHGLEGSLWFETDLEYVSEEGFEIADAPASSAAMSLDQIEASWEAGKSSQGERLMALQARRQANQTQLGEIPRVALPARIKG